MSFLIKNSISSCQPGLNDMLHDILHVKVRYLSQNIKNFIWDALLSKYPFYKRRRNKNQQPELRQIDAAKLTFARRSGASCMSDLNAVFTIRSHFRSSFFETSYWFLPACIEPIWSKRRGVKKWMRESGVIFIIKTIISDYITRYHWTLL